MKNVFKDESNTFSIGEDAEIKSRIRNVDFRVKLKPN